MVVKNLSYALARLAGHQRFVFRADTPTRISVSVAMTIFLLVGPGVVPAQPSIAAGAGEFTQNDLKSERDDDSWRSEFFKEINKRVKLAGLPRLDSVTLADDDLEVRVWNGFGLLALEGFVFKRKGKRWSGFHLQPVSSRQLNQKRSLRIPNSGWDNFWNRLTRAGILTLPDSSQLKDEVVVLDGVHLVVEVKTKESYRTYRYSNPKVQKWPEALRMLQIMEIIRAEFNPGRVS